MKPNQITIALDGPSGAGKSTVAGLLAKKLGILHLDTGAMYRAVGLKALRTGLTTDDEEAVRRMLETTKLEVILSEDRQRVLLDGEDVSTAIRTPEASLAASDFSKLPVVRHKLVELQRQMADRQSLILDGRDIGTYVLPQATCKIFLTAEPAERARRRLLDLQASGDHSATLEQVLQDIEYRDRQDAGRALAPLRQAEDAILVDSTDCSVEEVVDRITSYIKGIRHES
ncbi:MAG: (d)CMP kinase [Saccharofermentanales bacterium]|jgi:cytidylate kinase|nr:(d)CMP kinase [Clostridiaceae bacterium]